MWTEAAKEEVDEEEEEDQKEPNRTALCRGAGGLLITPNNYGTVIKRAFNEGDGYWQAAQPG